MRFRHGYTNDTRAEGSAVVKRYQGPGADARRSTELRTLTRLAGSAVPVPRVLGAVAREPGRDPALRLEHLPGTHGQDLIDAGHAAEVLRSCGRTLRQIQDFDEETLVHGDYGPNNMLFDPVTFATTAVLDWEWAHPGDPIEDLAWCEWIIRMHHPDAVAHLTHLFDGYGSRPGWSTRHDAMTARCRELEALFRPGSPGAHQWRRRIELTSEWT